MSLASFYLMMTFFILSYSNTLPSVQAPDIRGDYGDIKVASNHIYNNPQESTHWKARAKLYYADKLYLYAKSDFRESLRLSKSQCDSETYELIIDSCLAMNQPLEALSVLESYIKGKYGRDQFILLLQPFITFFSVSKPMELNALQHWVETLKIAEQDYIIHDLDTEIQPYAKILKYIVQSAIRVETDVITLFIKRAAAEISGEEKNENMTNLQIKVKAHTSLLNNIRNCEEKSCFRTIYRQNDRLLAIDSNKKEAFKQLHECKFVAIVANIEKGGFLVQAKVNIPENTIVLIDTPYVSFHGQVNGQACELCHKDLCLSNERSDSNKNMNSNNNMNNNNCDDNSYNDSINKNDSDSHDTSSATQQGDSPVPSSSSAFVARTVSCLECGETYCSEECRLLAYSRYHKALCKTGYRTIQDSVLKYGLSSNARLICLVVKLIGRAAVEKRSVLDLLPVHVLYRTLDRFQRSDPMRTVPQYTRQLEGMDRQFLTHLGSLYSENPELDVAVLAQLVSMLECNTYSVGDTSGGSGLFIQGSLFNHDCNPNLTWYSQDNRLCYITNRAIKVGEELTVSYIGDASHVRYEDKQIALETSYGFCCHCRICLTERSERDSQGLRSEFGVMGMHKDDVA